MNRPKGDFGAGTVPVAPYRFLFNLLGGCFVFLQWDLMLMEIINTGIGGLLPRLCEIQSIQHCLLKVGAHCKGRYFSHANFHG